MVTRGLLVNTQLLCSQRSTLKLELLQPEGERGHQLNAPSFTGIMLHTQLDQVVFTLSLKVSSHVM